MRASLLSRLKGTFRAADQWLKQTPERSLEQAYEAALMIKAIEDAHFQGKKISPQSDEFSETASAYLKSELSPYLTTVKIRLSEFKLSNPIVNFFSPTSSPGGQRGRASRNGNIANAQDYSAVVLEKLKFIDEVIGKYTNKRASSKSLIPIAQTTPYSDASKLDEHKGLLDEALESAETISDKTGVLPRSILGTISRIQRNLDPKAEAEVIRTFRVTQNKTFISLRFLLLLILFTLGTQILSKSFLVGPFVDHFRQETVEVFLNQDMEGEALRELQRYEDKLRFQHLIGQMPKLTAEQLDLKLKEKADEIATRFRYRSADAIKNLFADFLSLITFSVYLVFSRREVEVLKSFIDEIVYGLSDSAKAFIIILFTDIFVGFHSPHGWEVVLEGAARHLGLPENRDFIFIFIATFPVILDTVFKYWIFRYLNRVSPSAVATLRNMNE